MWSNHPIDLIFDMLIPGATKYDVISEATLLSSPKNVSMSKNIILYQANLLTILPRLLDFYILIIQFRHYTSVNVRLFYRFSASLLWMLSSLLI